MPAESGITVAGWETTDAIQGSCKHDLARPVQRRRLHPGADCPRTCQVPGCAAELTALKDYHRRYQICDLHSKADSVLLAGNAERFCQQCGRFHILAMFDKLNRSCRRRLDRHNKRRRKGLPLQQTRARPPTNAIPTSPPLQLGALQQNPPPPPTGQEPPAIYSQTSNMKVSLRQPAPFHKPMPTMCTPRPVISPTAEPPPPTPSRRPTSTTPLTSTPTSPGPNPTPTPRRQSPNQIARPSEPMQLPHNLHPGGASPPLVPSWPPAHPSPGTHNIPTQHPSPNRQLPNTFPRLAPFLPPHHPPPTHHPTRIATAPAAISAPAASHLPGSFPTTTITTPPLFASRQLPCTFQAAHGMRPSHLPPSSPSHSPHAFQQPAPIPLDNPPTLHTHSSPTSTLMLSSLAPPLPAHHPSPQSSPPNPPQTSTITTSLLPPPPNPPNLPTDLHKLRQQLKKQVLQLFDGPPGSRPPPLHPLDTKPLPPPTFDPSNLHHPSSTAPTRSIPSQPLPLPTPSKPDPFWLKAADLYPNPLPVTNPLPPPNLPTSAHHLRAHFNPQPSLTFLPSDPRHPTLDSVGNNNLFGLPCCHCSCPPNPTPSTQPQPTQYLNHPSLHPTIPPSAPTPRGPSPATNHLLTSHPNPHQHYPPISDLQYLRDTHAPTPPSDPLLDLLAFLDLDHANAPRPLTGPFPPSAPTCSALPVHFRPTTGNYTPSLYNPPLDGPLMENLLPPDLLDHYYLYHCLNPQLTL